ncbi:MAG: hypothetical protein VX133_05145, partial [Pseudomonadota bacterium]|nr:hypothetical protein [Pseudomonadota bacterium]
MYRRSLAQLLLNWSVLMLGLITSGLGYLLLQLQLEQFSSGWERRITFELDNLARDVEYHLESDNRYRIESRITERLTDSSVRYLAVLTEAGDQVIFSTRSADLVQGLSYRLSSHSLNTGIREAQI